MKLLLASSALGVGLTSALLSGAPTAPPGYCCFTLTAANPTLGSAVVEEDTIGENRIYGTYPDGAYCINPADAGKLYDSLGHTCIISLSTKRFQCTQGVRTQNEFVVAGNGDFFVDGSNNFWACPSDGPGDDKSLDIFANTKTDTTGCYSITMASTGDACAAPPSTPPQGTGTGAPSGTAPVSSGTAPVPSGTAPASSVIPVSSILSIPPSPYPTAGLANHRAAYFSHDKNRHHRGGPGRHSKPFVAGTGTGTAPVPYPTSTGSATCSQDLTAGNFVSPDVIVPVSREDAGHPYGNIADPIITPSNNTIFSFTIPSTWSGAMCSLLFTFPTADKTANPSAYHFSGVEEETGSVGGLNFDVLAAPIASNTTWWTMPAVKSTFGRVQIVPGNKYTVGSFPCAAGQGVAYGVSSVGGVEVEFEQSSEGAEPVGVWVAKC